MRHVKAYLLDIERGPENRVYAQLPAGAEVIDGGPVDHRFYVWAVGDHARPTTECEFILACGTESVGDRPLRHIASFLAGPTKLRYHLFEVLSP